MPSRTCWDCNRNCSSDRWGVKVMRAEQWFLVGGVLSAVGVTVLVISQIALARWIKAWKEE